MEILHRPNTYTVEITRDELRYLHIVSLSYSLQVPTGTYGLTATEMFAAQLSILSKIELDKTYAAGVE